MADKMMRARIRKRKEEAEAPKDILYTAETSGLPQSTLKKGLDMISTLKLNPSGLPDDDCMTILRLLGMNPQASIMEIGRQKMGLAPNATINWDQFTHIWRDALEYERGSRQMLETAFPFFDQDGSGFITCQEMVDQFKELGGLLSEEEIVAFHRILDDDGNGVIDYNEFMEALQPCIDSVAPDPLADAAAVDAAMSLPPQTASDQAQTRSTSYAHDVQETCRPRDEGLSLAPMYRATDESVPPPPVLAGALSAATTRRPTRELSGVGSGGSELGKASTMVAEHDDDAVDVVLVRNAVVE